MPFALHQQSYRGRGEPAGPGPDTPGIDLSTRCEPGVVAALGAATLAIEEQATDVDGAPDEWDDEEWADAIDEAREEADLAAGKGTLTVKQIDGRGYYYLQWRDGSTIKSQYVAPVSPADSN